MMILGMREGDQKQDFVRCTVLGSRFNGRFGGGGEDQNNDKGGVIWSYKKYDISREQ